MRGEIHFPAENPPGWRNSAWFKLFGEHPHIPEALRVDVSKGVLPQTPFVEYLHWRQSLDPTRFDYYHPRLGRLLAEQNLVPVTVTTPSIPNPGTPTTTPPTSPPISPPQGQTIVPEPGMLSIAAMMIASAAAVGVYRKRELPLATRNN